MVNRIPAANLSHERQLHRVVHPESTDPAAPCVLTTEPRESSWYLPNGHDACLAAMDADRNGDRLAAELCHDMVTRYATRWRVRTHRGRAYWCCFTYLDATISQQ